MIGALNCKPLACQVPLYPGAWNVWQLVRAATPDLTREQIVEDLEALFGRGVLAAAGLDWATWLPRGRATDLGIHTFLAEGDGTDHTDHDALAVAERKISEEYQGSSSPILSADVARCPGEATLEAESYTRILVQFVWRGSETSMGWPAARRVTLPNVLPGVQPDEWWRECGNEATYLVTEVYAPQERAVPATPLEKLGKTYGSLVETIGKAANEARSDILWAQAIGAAVVVGGILLFMRRGG